jgi:hypothetical protein
MGKLVLLQRVVGCGRSLGLCCFQRAKTDFHTNSRADNEQKARYSSRCPENRNAFDSGMGRGLAVGDPAAMEPQWNANWQVNARNRCAREILRCKNYQICPAAIEIVSICHDIAVIFTGAQRRGNKYRLARCAALAW